MQAGNESLIIDFQTLKVQYNFLTILCILKQIKLERLDTKLLNNSTWGGMGRIV